MAKCKSCGAYIKWIKTSAGRSMPVDSKERLGREGSEKLVLILEDGSTVHCVGGTGEAYKGYVSHFATCPHSDQHRKDLDG